MKTLYFEGAGMSSAESSKATIGNCRIRTAFHLDDGRAVYLEIIGNERAKNSNLAAYRWRYTGFVDTCYYITDDMPNDDCCEHQIIFPGEEESGGWLKYRTFEYTREQILRFVNDLGASFDAVAVVPDLGGYRVFRETQSQRGTEQYNYGDEFQLDTELLTRRETVHKLVYDIEMDELREKKSCRSFPNFALWVDESDPVILHLLRHLGNGNKHWEIRIDAGAGVADWMASAVEAPLGRCGC